MDVKALDKLFFSTFNRNSGNNNSNYHLLNTHCDKNFANVSLDQGGRQVKSELLPIFVKI